MRRLADAAFTRLNRVPPRRPGENAGSLDFWDSTALPQLEDVARRLATAHVLLANVPDPVVLVGPDNLVAEANAAARTLFPTLMLGRPLSYGVRAPELLDAVAAASPDGAVVQVEYRTRTPTERVFDVHVAALPHADEGPVGTSGVLLFFRDLTDVRRVERMRVDFVANVSHELRTPLASLVGFIETLQGSAQDDPASRARFLEIMHTQAWRMTRLIEDLLSLSRIELREHVAPDAPVDLRSVAAQIVDGLSGMARERGVTIAISASHEPTIVLGDADELSRVVENLVENAVKYGESGGRVEVVIERRDAEAELVVRDYGPGISHEHLPRLTERFYRVDVAQSREKGGTGLGLAIVKHIVNRHRGRLAIESAPGEGAIFRVVLPAHDAAPAPSGPGAS
jgi:two-component system phosphate regulon sensor histidine kinase PhoR